MKLLLSLFVVFLCFCAFSESSYLDQLEGRLPALSKKEKIEAIHDIPFDEMNSNQPETIRYYEEALRLAKELNNPFLIAETKRLLNIVTYYAGDYDKAAQYALEAIKYFESVNNKQKLGDLYTQYGFQIKRKDLKKGMTMMRKGLNQLEAINDTFVLSGAYNNYGVLHQMNQNLDSALYFFNKGLKIVRSKNDSLGIPYSLNNVGVVYLELKEFDVAKRYFDEALHIRKLRDDQNGIAENYVFEGEFYMAQANYFQAIESLKKSLAIAEEINYKFLSQYDCDLLAKCYSELGDYKTAFEYQSKSNAYKEELLNEKTLATISQLEIQYETEKKEKELAEHKIELREKTIKQTQQFYLVIALAIFILLGTVIAIIVIRQQRFKANSLLEENRLKDKLAEVQVKNQLHEERLRISRDLHDNIGSQLTFITSSMDNLKFIVTENNVSSKLTELTDFTRTTISKLRDTIWAMNKETISIQDFRGRLYDYINGVKKLMPEVRFKLETELEYSQLDFSSIQGIYLFRIFQEATNNALKYAEPKEIVIALHEFEDYIQFYVTDDGKGFDMETTPLGNGLINMRHRAEEIGAIVSFVSHVDKGTKVELRIPKNKLNAVLDKAKNWRIFD